MWADQTKKHIFDVNVSVQRYITKVQNKKKLVHLHLFDGIFQLSDLTLNYLLVGQDEVDLLGDLVLGDKNRSMVATIKILTQSRQAARSLTLRAW